MTHATIAFGLLLAFLAFERHQSRLSTDALLSRLADLAMTTAPDPQPSPDLTVLVELVENLAQRLQAPAAAVAMHAAAASDPLFAPPAVSPESDEDYWENRLGKEEMAQLIAMQEAAAAAQQPVG